MSEPSPARVARVIWMALTIAVVIYAVLAFTMVPIRQDVPFASYANNPMFVVLAIFGVVMFGLSFVVPALMLRTVPSGTARPAPSFPQARTRARLVVRWALTETPAIFGLMAAFIGRDARLFIPLGVLSVVGMLMSYPSDSVLESAEG
jgi:hypothetical protein